MQSRGHAVCIAVLGTGLSLRKGLILIAPGEEDPLVEKGSGCVKSLVGGLSRLAEPHLADLVRIGTWHQEFEHWLNALGQFVDLSGMVQNQRSVDEWQQ